MATILGTIVYVAVDPVTGEFVHNSAGNALRHREYRKPFTWKPPQPEAKTKFG